MDCLGVYMQIAAFTDFRERIINNISQIIVGKNDLLDSIVIAFICGGHILLEDIPGVGKTSLVKAFARSVGSRFSRVQFTPDLLPSDLTGIHYFNPKVNDFEFRPGPLFADLILGDEINRATPRTQSSLLEAMEEKQITVDGVTRKLADSFMVLATQNPIESYGVFPLPEAQLDRFMMRLSVGYPSRTDEILIATEYQKRKPEELSGVVTEAEIDYVKKAYQEVRCHTEVTAYLLDIVEATRQSGKARLGTSPRGSIALYRASQACAAISGREYVLPEDVKRMAPYVLNHRVLWKNPDNAGSLYHSIEEIVNEVRVPVEDGSYCH